MLQSKTFTGGIRVAPEKSAHLLSHIVTTTLTGESLTERALLIDFYGYTADQLLITKTDIDAARIGVLRLRKKLKAYYDNEGLDDNVRIDIPKGQYKADFSINHTSPARKELRLGHISLEQGQTEEARSYFKKALQLEPALADAWAGLASERIASLYHLEHDGTGRLSEAEEACEKALALDENCWRAHAEIGAIALFRHEWEKADAAIWKAKQIAPLEITQVATYATFLVSRGYNDDARDLAYYLNEQFDRPYLQIRAAHMFYGLGESERARAILGDVGRRNTNIWQVSWLRAWICLQMGEPDEAYATLFHMKRLFSSSAPALHIFCYEGVGEYETARAIFDAMHSSIGEVFGVNRELRTRHYPSTVEYALGCLARGEEEQAITSFGEACEKAAPFTAWLHVDPILNPLRKHRSFRELLRQWNYPRPDNKGGRLGPA